MADQILNPSGSTSRSVRDAIQLAMLPGIGPRILASLLERFETPQAVLAASGPELATVQGVGSKLIHTIRTAADFIDVDAILTWCHQNQVDVICFDDDRYPMPLKELNDAPPLLFLQGDLTASDLLSVAIVGTRHATNYGLQQAERIAYGLAKAGVTVVSGLARGIDSAAHTGALDGGGRTLAVLGSGLGHIYPSENKALARRCAASGALLSEYGPDIKPRAGQFPQRNRLIAGIGLATLVIEAPDRSGALITARLAGEQNRDVLALPGPVTSRTSRGCNQLIRDGAVLVQTIDDILEAIGPMKVPVETEDGHQLRNPAELNLNEIEQLVLQSIDTTSTAIDHVIARSGLPAHRVIATVSVLEMRHLIRRLSGQYVLRI